MRKLLFSSTFTYSFLVFLQPAISFFLLPVFLTYFTLEDYGIYNMINTISYFLGVIAAFRIQASINTFYYDFRKSRERLLDFMGNIMGFVLLSAFIYTIILLLIGGSLFDLIFKNEIAFFPNGLYGVISGVFLSIVESYLLFLRNDQRLRGFIFVSLLLTGLTVSLQLLFIIPLQMGITGALFGRACAVVLSGIICLWLSRRFFTFKFKKNYIRPALQFSVPLIPFSIVAWISRYIDRYAIEQSSDTATLGLYTLLSTICILMIMANDGLVSGVQPIIFDIVSNEKTKSRKNVARIVKAFLHGLLLFGSLLIVVFTNINVWFPDSEYNGIIPYVAFGISVFYLYGFYSVLKLELLFYKKSNLLSIISIVYAVFLIVTLFILVPDYGIWGALFSNFLGMILLVTLTWKGSGHTGFLREMRWTDWLLPIFGIFIMTSVSFANTLQYISLIQFGILLMLVTIVHRKDVLQLFSKSPS